MTDLTKYSGADLPGLSDEEFGELLSSLVEVQKIEYKENQIRYYKPVSPSAKQVHFSVAHTVGIGGGNGSSKTETSFAEMVMCASGIFPQWALDEMPEELIRQKAPGPMHCRVVLANFKAQLSKMLKKFQWWEWTGPRPLGGERGHWGWIPHSHLVNGDWDASWIAGVSTLRFKCVDPYDTTKELGLSEIQFMSSGMETLAMAGVDLQFCVMDEPSNLSIYRENKARCMRGDGRLFMPMTWLDDGGIDVDWIFDEVHDKAEHSDQYDWFILSSFDNPHLPQNRVEEEAADMSDEVRRVRIEGGNMRFSSLIHPQFTSRTKMWCFRCRTDVMMTTNEKGTHVCARCKRDDIEPFCHVSEFDPNPAWPTVFIIDPHPRKPHMFQWVQIDPYDDLWQIAEGELAEAPDEVMEMVTRIEDQFGLHIGLRLMDPNMGASPCGANREISWQDEFRTAGLDCQLADDSGVGRARLNEYIKCDENTRRPRFNVHSRCNLTISQMGRYMWDNHKQDLGRDQKQVPKPKNDDFPNNLKYLVNANPRFHYLRYGARPISTRIKKEKPNGRGRRMR